MVHEKSLCDIDTESCASDLTIIAKSIRCWMHHIAFDANSSRPSAQHIITVMRTKQTLSEVIHRTPGRKATYLVHSF